MNAKSRKKRELGNCPNCGSPLHEGHYGAIPLKEESSTMIKLQESLIICKTCLNKPEKLSSENVKKNLEEAEIKWEEGDIALAVSAVEAYKGAKLATV